MKSIKRSKPTSDTSPPWAGMDFTEPVESDALHELLKQQYPRCKTLRQRKHMAAIDFLKRELDSMQDEATEATTRAPHDDEASTKVDACSPDLQGFAKRKHQRSVSPSLSRSSSYRSPALLDHHTQQLPVTLKVGAGQQHVFSIVDGYAMQPKKKRKMTPAERSAYKTMRKVGACEKCKRQKGKCTHVIEPLGSVGKLSSNGEVASQRLDTTLQVLMAAFNTEEPARNHQQTQDFSQQQRTSLRTSPITQFAIAPGSPQWAQEMQERQEGSQSEISGYVNSYVSVPHPRALHNNQEARWSSRSSFNEPEAFQTDCNGYMVPPDLNGVSPSFSPFPGLSPKDAQYPPDFFEPSWNQSMDYMPGEANPG